MRSKKVDKKNISELNEICRRVRIDVLTMAHGSGSSHVGPALSCVEVLVALYHRVMKLDSADPLSRDRDRFILSKGHAVMALYACLSRKSFFKKEKLTSYCMNGSDLAEHPLANKLPGVEFATGSLGHGLAIGIGLAMASRLNRTPYNVYVLMGDGETNEGSVWEAAGLASTFKLHNLIALIDCNQLQATDTYDNLSGGCNMKEAWNAFGWQVCEVDGHSIGEIVRVFDNSFYEMRKPKVVICRTVKGKGVSFMENNLEWHYKPPNSDDLKKAVRELEIC